MNKYHVTFYYLASGMEGVADTRDYGYVYANSSQEAMEIVGKRNHPKADKFTQLWGLSAQKVHEYVFVPPGLGMTHLKEYINELDQFESKQKMNDNLKVLRTQTDAINAIRSKFYIIASVASNGDFSLSASPAVHTCSLDARTEAKRLAQLSPGKAFVILTLSGAEMVPVSTVSI